MKVKLSAVIITFNEERNLERCLKSLEGVADEIVVVDSFSTDATMSIALNFGVKFIQHTFEGHIQQKNFAITQATHKHILSLDADECLSDALKQSIIQVKNNWQYDGYSMNRLTNYCGHWVRHCGWYPDRKLRLWNCDKGHWTGTNPHDRYELFDKQSTTGFVRGDLLHYSYYTIDDHKKQIAYFTDIAARAMHAQRMKATIAFALISACVKFLRDYILKLGFLDGTAGFTICRLSAYASYLKYYKLYKLNQSSR
jgi:glycosyltransferase involved in cell wall biosynthesis